MEKRGMHHMAASAATGALNKYVEWVHRLATLAESGDRETKMFALQLLNRQQTFVSGVLEQGTRRLKRRVRCPRISRADQEAA